MQRIIAILPIMSLAACAELGLTPVAAPPPEDAVVETALPEETPPPVDQTEIAKRKPPARAVTAEQFDTTTEEERAAAAAPAPPPATGPLGTTIASLGDPTEQGFWLKTPLVSAVRNGRLVYGANGKSVQVELRPSGGAAGSGSQISLAALRLLEAPLTELVELEVFPE